MSTTGDVFVTLTLARGPSLTEQAAAHIRGRIVHGTLQCGEPLSELALAQELGVSKTPVREALLELKRQGLVEIHPQRGTFVFEMSSAQVVQLAEMRSILELAALRLAMDRNGQALSLRWAELVAAMDVAMANENTEDYRVLDGVFHQVMFDLAENQFLSETFTVIAFRIQALRNRLSLDPALNEKSHGEHKRLVALAAGGEAEKVAELLAWHIEWTRSSYIDLLGLPAGDSRSTRGGERRLKAGK
ncbi:GntR family transcriptional regulator [Phyllobacterium endophyticum]|uniref:GntR family transcriptional regulator n=1 Tax=Phyllobacterium endophyticum TaxID=1149773 RepID=A0A2P7ARP5_9HYPH|nr:GntR family transcriptional regulator [Phyllobacterium endophyticum]MBB3236514.1 DNA-binding GntR family transcriptional regulator [Phyllobacterium endophyticum]PSH56850.1 GntR family transcriptional regulator [Phyllobacterium endophyticum]TYR39524.1 GntR family transcriptional regulator [Phyllobacterium endophyticum]